MLVADTQPQIHTYLKGGGGGGGDDGVDRGMGASVSLDTFLVYCSVLIITKTSLSKYTENFTTPPKKNENFRIKILIYFHISAQNIDCGYSLEPPRRCGSNEYPNLRF